MSGQPICPCTRDSRSLGGLILGEGSGLFDHREAQQCFLCWSACTKLEASQLAHNGEGRECPAWGTEGLPPLGALSWWSPSHQEPFWTIWSFPQRSSPTCSFTAEKIEAQGGEAGLRVVMWEWTRVPGSGVGSVLWAPPSHRGPRLEGP